VPLDATSEDDYTRAVAEKADALLRAAQFVGSSSDHEVRIWIEAAAASACVSVTHEPGARSFGFYLLDESLTERLACVVFDDLPCVGARESEAQLGAILDAMRQEGAPKEPVVRVRVKGRKPRDEP